MSRKDDNWIPEEDLPSWGRIYGGLVKLPDDTILSVYIQMGDVDVELVEATIALMEVTKDSIIQRQTFTFERDPLTTKELAQKITIDGREISIRQHICETIIPYYKKTRS